MNAPRPLFPILSRAAALLAVGAACLLSAGCVGNPFAGGKVDPASPVAADVARLGRQPGKAPTFASIPNPPTNARPAAQYGRDAKRTLSAGEALVAATEPGTWTLQGTQAFAEAARRDAGPAVEPAKPGDADAFAKAQRDRATPPPPR